MCCPKQHIIIMPKEITDLLTWGKRGGMTDSTLSACSLWTFFFFFYIFDISLGFKARTENLFPLGWALNSRDGNLCQGSAVSSFEHNSIITVKNAQTARDVRSAPLHQCSRVFSNELQTSQHSPYASTCHTYANSRPDSNMIILEH